VEWLDFSVVSPCEELVNRMHDVFVQWGVLAAANHAVIAPSLPVDSAKIEFEGRTLKMSLYRHVPSSESQGNTNICPRTPSIGVFESEWGVERRQLQSRVVLVELCRASVATRATPRPIWCARHH
jgi:hypothetical protein